MKPTNAFDLGFYIWPRDQFFSDTGPVVRCYQGSTNRKTDELACLHAEKRAALMRRVLPLEGKFVLWCPDDDAEGFVLVGDDAVTLLTEAFEYEMDIRAVAKEEWDTKK